MIPAALIVSGTLFVIASCYAPLIYRGSSTSADQDTAILLLLAILAYSAAVAVGLIA